MKRASLETLKRFTWTSSFNDERFALYFAEQTHEQKLLLIRDEYDSWGYFHKGTVLVDGEEMSIPHWGRLSLSERKALIYCAHEVALKNLKLPV